MIALLMLDRLDEALQAARNAYPRLLREGDEYRMLLSLALLNALHGRLHVAARIVGFDDAVGARIGENVNVFASLFHERLDPLLAAAAGRRARAPRGGRRGAARRGGVQARVRRFGVASAARSSLICLSMLPARIRTSGGSQSV